MIVQLRVDDRLVHGQIALVWSKCLGTSRIVVANDNAASNDTVKTVLNMAVPDGIKLLVRSVSDSYAVFNNPKSENVPLFVLTQNVTDALKVVQNCPGRVKAVNIANVGKFDNVPMNEKTPFLDGFFSQKELDACKELVKIEGVEVYHQITPEKAQESVGKALREKKL